MQFQVVLLDIGTLVRRTPYFFTFLLLLLLQEQEKDFTTCFVTWTAGKITFRADFSFVEGTVCPISFVKEVLVSWQASFPPSVVNGTVIRPDATRFIGLVSTQHKPSASAEGVQYCQPVRWGEVGVDRPSAKVLRYGSPYLMIRDVLPLVSALKSVGMKKRHCR